MRNLSQFVISILGPFALAALSSRAAANPRYIEIRSSQILEPPPLVCGHKMKSDGTMEYECRWEGQPQVNFSSRPGFNGTSLLLSVQSPFPGAAPVSTFLSGTPVTPAAPGQSLFSSPYGNGNIPGQSSLPTVLNHLGIPLEIKFGLPTQEVDQPNTSFPPVAPGDGPVYKFFNNRLYQLIENDPQSAEKKSDFATRGPMGIDPKLVDQLTSPVRKVENQPLLLPSSLAQLQKGLLVLGQSSLAAHRKTVDYINNELERKLIDRRGILRSYNKDLFPPLSFTTTRYSLKGIQVRASLNEVLTLENLILDQLPQNKDREDFTQWAEKLNHLHFVADRLAEANLRNDLTLVRNDIEQAKEIMGEYIGSEDHSPGRITQFMNLLPSFNTQLNPIEDLRGNAALRPEGRGNLILWAEQNQQAITDEAEESRNLLNEPKVTAQIEIEAAEYFREQLIDSETLARDVVSSTKSDLPANVVRLAMTVARETTTGIKSYLLGVKAGIQGNLKTKADAIEAIFSNPERLTRISEAILNTITDPTDFMRYASTSILNFHIKMGIVTGILPAKVAIRGKIAGELSTELLIGMAMGTTAAPINSGLTHLAKGLIGTEASEILGVQIAEGLGRAESISSEVVATQQAAQEILESVPAKSHAKILESFQDDSLSALAPVRKLDYEFNLIQNPGPLVEINPGAASTFRSGMYNARILKEDKIIYRLGEGGGGKNAFGQYFTEVPVTFLEGRIDLGVKPEWIDPHTGALIGSSPLETIYAIKVPKGTTIFEGPAGYQSGIYLGGKTQIYVHKPWKLQGVEVISEKPLRPKL